LHGLNQTSKLKPFWLLQTRIRLRLPRANFGGKTRPENMINDVEHEEGCLI